MMMIGANPNGNRKSKLYGDPLVRVVSLLNNLRLKYNDVNKDNVIKRFIDIPLFGVRIVFSGSTTNYDSSKKMMYFNPEAGEQSITDFGHELMWHLIENGYMAYIRHHIDGNNENIFRKLIISEGWGRRILDKRLEEWQKNPHKRFICSWLRDIKEGYGTTEIISRFPTIYDFLY